MCLVMDDVCTRLAAAAAPMLLDNMLSERMCIHQVRLCITGPHG